MLFFRECIITFILSDQFLDILSRCLAAAFLFSKFNVFQRDLSERRGILKMIVFLLIYGFFDELSVQPEKFLIFSWIFRFLLTIH